MLKGNAITGRWSLMLSIVILFHFGLNIAVADSQSTTVKEILARPQSYQLHTVTLHGTATNVQKVPPKAMDYCINRHTFTLTDETGSIQVYIEGICANRVPLPPEVTEREVVFVEGTVQAIDPAEIPQPPNNKVIGGEQGVRLLGSKIWR